MLLTSFTFLPVKHFSKMVRFIPHTKIHIVLKLLIGLLQAYRKIIELSGELPAPRCTNESD